MSYRRTKSLCAGLGIGLAGLVFVASPALGKEPIIVKAPESEDIAIRRISYADLNLASLAGEQTLNRRVRNEVTSLCTEIAGNQDDKLSSAIDRCHGYAWIQARPQIANAVQRAREIATTGTSALSAAAITFSIPQ